ncbi:hypothetical protein OS965_37230 [Streptomyces sp. H27-G5]|uniref:hypothetical protein n=1 Tax=Streptomyces sp. H27-G5 TaxID=2996698 RepID=UPI002271F7EB|nr:hypothetical protein [Streptomyces sp. H27-G5]MCY0923725.1 hypothetical protein [Streptomyces sp. H27-G5]
MAAIDVRGAAGEVRAVAHGTGPVWVVLSRGSWRLLGMGCRCLGQLAGGIWTAVSQDPAREAEARARAVKAAEARQRKRAAAKAAKKAADLDDEDLVDEDDEDLVEAAAVLSAKTEAAIREASARPLFEALALLGLGGAVATVGAAVLVRVAAGPAAAWAGPVWDTWSGLITTGALTLWAGAAIAAGPSMNEAADIIEARKTRRSRETPQQDHSAGECSPGAPDPVEPADDAEAPIETAEAVEIIRRVAARHGHGAVHLVDLTLEPEFEGWTVSELREECAVWGVPTEDQISLRFAAATPTGKAGKRVRSGVRLTALPAVGIGVPAGAPGSGPAGVSGPVGETPTPAPAEAPVQAPANPPVQAPANPPGLAPRSGPGRAPARGGAGRFRRALPDPGPGPAA